MKCFLFIFVALFLFSPAKQIFAHEIVTDGSMSILMHIDPDDKPVSNEKSIIHLGITDSKNKFSISKCNCMITISTSGKTITTKKAEDYKGNSGLYNLFLPIVFPNSGVFTIDIEGTPSVDGAFQAFKASFNVRVESSVLSKTYSTPFTFIILVAVIIISFVSVLLIIKRLIE